MNKFEISPRITGRYFFCRFYFIKILIILLSSLIIILFSCCSDSQLSVLLTPAEFLKMSPHLLIITSARAADILSANCSVRITGVSVVLSRGDKGTVLLSPFYLQFLAKVTVTRVYFSCLFLILWNIRSHF